MRSTADVSAMRVPRRPRRRVFIVVALLVIVIALLSLRSVSVLYTDSLWYSSIGEHGVWATIIETKVGLFLTFGFVFFLGLWGNLLLCNRLGPSELYLDAPEDELVRRYRGAVRPYAGRLYALVALVLSLIAASSTIGRWQQYLLFANSKPFGLKDPLWHLDYSFYVFRLPFLTFVVDWLLASVFAMFLLTAIFHYLNGGIRAARVSPRVAPAVKAHLSVLLAILAILKAAGYLLARYHMVTSTSNTITEGAGYTDVHARLPALLVLFWLCLAAAAILLWNIRQRGWTLPAIAVGLWAFVALVIGVVYPAILQAVHVTPAQSVLEKPYIARNITATRAAYGLDDVINSPIPSATNRPLASQPGVSATLQDLREWDPTANVTEKEFQNQQALRPYYSFPMLGEDPYVIDGKLTPTILGVRELNSSGLPNQTWENSHLVYTHGYGVVMIPSNQDEPSTTGSQPVFTVEGIPTKVASGWQAESPRFPQIYFGLNQGGYVVANTKAPELDYEGQTQTVTSHYTGSGGVKMGGVFRRLMFAVRFGEPNLFFSNLITPSSRIMFVRNVVQIAQRAAPFLSIDAHPYAVVVDGHVDWILDGYTTTDQYPYSQNASTQLVPTDTGLPGSYNYVRNSVKIVVDAYTGKVWLYEAPPVPGISPDPILKAWEAAFPGLVHPYSSMPVQLQDHMRYPEDLFSIQAAIYGRYHLTSPAAFYNSGGGWSISPTYGSGKPTQSLRVTSSYNKQGLIVSQTAARMDPLYQLFALPGSSTPELTLTDAYVAASANTSVTVSSTNFDVYNLTAYMVATSNAVPDYGGTKEDYGQLYVYHAVEGGTLGPVQAVSKMGDDQIASKAFSLLNTQGTHVLLGNILMVPVNGSILYVRPAYEVTNSTGLPNLTDVLALYKTRIGFSTTLQGALDQALYGAKGPSAKKGTTAAQLLEAAEQDFQSAQAALAQKNLGLYQHYVTEANTDVIEAAKLLGAKKVSPPPTTRSTNG